jgi:hypothetical protein
MLRLPPHVEVDGDVEVDPVVDLDLDPRWGILDQDSSRSAAGVDVQGPRRESTSTQGIVDLDVDPHVEVDGDVEVDPVVDLDLDPRGDPR